MSSILLIKTFFKHLFTRSADFLIAFISASSFEMRTDCKPAFKSTRSRPDPSSLLFHSSANFPFAPSFTSVLRRFPSPLVLINEIKLSKDWSMFSLANWSSSSLPTVLLPSGYLAATGFKSSIFFAVDKIVSLSSVIKIIVFVIKTPNKYRCSDSLKYTESVLFGLPTVEHTASTPSHTLPSTFFCELHSCLIFFTLDQNTSASISIFPQAPAQNPPSHDRFVCSNPNHDHHPVSCSPLH
mmetsp:Transcript_10614/g.19919  ORF Transcript_10614/g.19919 Transcript_10614/m.19919 type:complete len:240 (-) Transcript_10614:254-973(-)